MTYLLDYLAKENQKITEKKPFDYIDAFILSAFAYLPVGKDIRKFKGEGLKISHIAVKDFCNLLIENDEILKFRFGCCTKSLKDYREMAILLKYNERYKDIKILEFVYENMKDSQFACFALDLGENNYCIAYRGTDGTRAGWHENFSMLEEITQAQRLSSQVATKYLSQYENGNFYFAGHSKGGNLAAFAGIDLFPIHGNKIKFAYNFDGPGFNKEFLRDFKDNINMIRGKIASISIENTVVAELLFGQEEIYGNDRYFIKTKTTLNILKEHCPFFWRIKNGDFVFTHQSSVSHTIAHVLDEITLKTPPALLRSRLETMLRSISLYKSSEAQKIINVLKHLRN